MTHDMSSADAAPDAVTFRQALSRVPTSVVAVSAMHEGRAVGMLVGTFTSVSLEPLLVGFLGDRGSSTLPTLLRAGTVAFSVLRETDLRTVEAFRRPSQARFEGVSWELDRQFGSPVLTGAPLVVFGRPWAETDAGDHIFVLVEVLGVRTSGPARPLVFCGRRLTRMDPGHMVDNDIWQLGWHE
jgi:3-hydroxy-9,10-secoandrosta-1,3,5(10)-triene-9,17-dione monooxygenase reductase component